MKPTTRLILSLSVAATLIAATSCSDAANIVRFATSDQVEASGPMVRQTRSLSPSVAALTVTAGLSVEYVQADSAKIIVEAPQNLLDIISTTLDSGVLTICPTKGFSTQRGQTVRITVMAPSIARFEAKSGSSLSIAPGYKMPQATVDAAVHSGSTLSIASITAQGLQSTASSGATASISEIQVGDLRAKASSGATLSLSGRATTASLNAAGGASLAASDLAASSGSANASGGASISSNIRNATTSSSGGASVRNR